MVMSVYVEEAFCAQAVAVAVVVVVAAAAMVVAMVLLVVAAVRSGTPRCFAAWLRSRLAE
jgi:hypothetical protein